MINSFLNLLEHNILFRFLANKEPEETIQKLISQMKDITMKDSNGNNIVHFSIIHSNFKIVPTLISSGIKVNEQGQFGYSALHLATLKGNEQLITDLIKNHSADPNIKDNDGEVPLHKAIRVGNQSIMQCLINNRAILNIKVDSPFLHVAYAVKSLPSIELLVKLGADLNIKDSNGYSLLHLAAMDDFPSLLLLYSEFSKSLYDPDIKDNDGETPLHKATRLNKWENVEILIKIGSNINEISENNSKSTPLHLATLAGAVNIIKVLINRKADLNMKEGNGFTPLHLSVLNSELPVQDCPLDSEKTSNEKADFSMKESKKAMNPALDFLLDPGNAIDVNIPTNEGLNALHLSVIAKKTNSAKKMISCHRFDLNFKDANGEAIIHKAIVYDQPELVKLLIQEGVPVNQRNERNGNSLFHLAVMHSKNEALSYLLKYSSKQEYNEKNNMGLTPLHYAIKKNDVIIVENLLKKKDIELIDKITGYSILQFAIISHSRQIIEFLVQNAKTRLVWKDKEGLPVLHLSIRSDCSIDIQKLLIDFGVDLNERDNNGWTPLHHAARKGNFELIKFLNSKAMTSPFTQKDNKGIYPICWAALYKHIKVFKLLFLPEILNESLVFAVKENFS